VHAAGAEPEDAWYDDDAGPVVRPYTMTRGRTQPSRGQFDLISLVVARPSASPAAAQLSPEQIEIVERTRRPLSVAEIAAELDLPLGTVRVLLGDLLEAGLIETHAPLVLAESPSEELLEAVLAGLRAL
jgi:DNA-binding transcriptional ArsR family regulator